MSDINYSVGKTICFVWGIIILCTPGTQASTLPPDPNNAALLYYQAFLLRPEPDYVVEQLVYNTRPEKIYDILCGADLELGTDTGKQIRELDEKMRSVDPNAAIRKYIRNCRDTIELVQATSEISECDWGILYSRGLACRLPQLVEIRPLTRILCTDALLLAADGNFRAAFEHCLMIRRFAHQIGDDIVLQYFLAKSIDTLALDCIRMLLGHMESEVDTLTWLKNQLVAQKVLPGFPVKVLKIDFGLTLQSLRINDDILEKTRQALRMKEEIKALVKEKLTQDNVSERDIQSLTDEELVTLAGDPYATFLDSALQVMSSEVSYEKKNSDIQRLKHELEMEFGGDPASYPIMTAHPEKLLTLSVIMACADQVLNSYNIHVRNTVHFNALMAGIEVYLVRVQIGKLPVVLPEGLPKDPFSGKDFDYKVTEGGFMIRCTGKDIDASRKEYRPGKPPVIISEFFQEYDFKVQN